MVSRQAAFTESDVFLQMGGQGHGSPGVFESTLSMLFENYPIGAAFDFFNERHAAAAVQLDSLLERWRPSARRVSGP
jgi:hypothetical protein